MLLSALAHGDLVPIVDPTSRRTAMRSLPTSVIGVLTTADCALLHEVAAASYAATAFVPAVPAPTGDSAGLVTLVRHVGAISGDAAVTLRLPAEMLTGAAEAWPRSPRARSRRCRIGSSSCPTLPGGWRRRCIWWRRPAPRAR